MKNRIGVIATLGSFVRVLAIALPLAAASTAGHATLLNVSQNIGDVAGNTGQLNNNVNYSGVVYHVNNIASASSGTVDFDLDLYRSMDGVNCCTDTLTVSISVGSNIFQGALPAPNGGGSYAVFANSLGASVTNTYFNGSTDLGAIYHFSFLTPFSPGNNDITLSYSALQSYGDEAWGVNNFAAQAVPEPVSLTLLCLGLAGLGFSRRRKA